MTRSIAAVVVLLNIALAGPARAEGQCVPACRNEKSCICVRVGQEEPQVCSCEQIIMKLPDDEKNSRDLILQMIDQKSGNKLTDADKNSLATELDNHRVKIKQLVKSENKSGGKVEIRVPETTVGPVDVSIAKKARKATPAGDK